MKYEQYLTQPAAGVAGGLTPTPADIEGPFYKEGAPFRFDISEGLPGVLYLVGRVTDTDSNDIVGAVLDFWQASPEGEYDNEGFRFRGKVTARSSTRTGDIARYGLRTVRPGCYEISDTESRCPHIHVKVTAPGFVPLTTQLYFPDGEFNSTDRWFKPALLLTPADGGYRFDFVLRREGE